MLNQYLKTKQISIYRLSKISGVPYTTLNELIIGKREIDDCSVKTVRLISSVLNVSMDELYQICHSREKLPYFFKACFWDCDFNSLDLIRNKNFIISRLLDYGSIDGYKFVVSNYSREEIIDTIKKSRLFSRKIATYLSFIYAVKKEDMKYFKFSKKEWQR